MGGRTTWRVMASPHAASDYRFAEQARFPNETMLVVCDRPYVYSCQNVHYATPKPHMHGINPRFYAQVMPPWPALPPSFDCHPLLSSVSHGARGHALRDGCYS